ncbi:E3 ubiquitin/ISG15 ligase TRIM25-like [Hyperolius riggenbachi]|uniref:E3 ubiquitin/ISG15 ligase TRIM25-like n=1 Tax=Hyperolius riggenbachi TaxID=752182 RepID=UPI0035A34BE7
MASADVKKELLDCSICLNTYTDPVTLRCGHNFCRVCIDRVLDTQERCGGYSCPECRAESEERPVLIRNITLCNIVGSFLPAQPDQESGVVCTYCVDSPVPAVKSCLMCEASLCDKHLRVHSKSSEHVMAEPTTSLENRKCSGHKELLKYYCPQDNVCICVSCRLAGEHQGHKVEMLDEASEKKKMRLREDLQELVREEKEAKEKVRRLQKHQKKMTATVSDVTEKVTALFRDLKRQLEDLEKRVLSEISRQQEQKSGCISNMLRQLEIKQDKLSRRMNYIEEVCNMTDPLAVLQEPDTGGMCDTDGKDKEDREGPDKQNQDREDLDVGLISLTLQEISEMISDVKRGLFIGEPVTILLDVNTAHDNLLISDDRKTASLSTVRQRRPVTPERFQYYCNVLSTGSYSSGQYYWEFECSAGSEWEVGMCYPSVNRDGTSSSLVCNKKCWCLQKAGKQYVALHDTKIQLPSNIVSTKFRITLDYEAGKLSFYELCDPIRHLHTFTATFTEPLHAALHLVCKPEKGYWVRMLDCE